MSQGAADKPGCPACQRREQRIAELAGRVAQREGQLEALRKQLDDAQQAGQRQAAPFRRRQHQANPKKPGRPKGHQRAARAVPEHVERALEVPWDACPDCPVPLVERVVHAHYQTHRPPVVPVVTQFNLEGLPAAPKRGAPAPARTETCPPPTVAFAPSG